jgi:hypothetical protein
MLINIILVLTEYEKIKYDTKDIYVFIYFNNICLEYFFNWG